MWSCGAHRPLSTTLVIGCMERQLKFYHMMYMRVHTRVHHSGPRSVDLGIGNKESGWGLEVRCLPARVIAMRAQLRSCSAKALAIDLSFNVKMSPTPECIR